MSSFEREAIEYTLSIDQNQILIGLLLIALIVLCWVSMEDDNTPSVGMPTNPHLRSLWQRAGYDEVHYYAVMREPTTPELVHALHQERELVRYKGLHLIQLLEQHNFEELTRYVADTQLGLDRITVAVECRRAIQYHDVQICGANMSLLRNRIDDSLFSMPELIKQLHTWCHLVLSYLETVEVLERTIPAQAQIETNKGRS